MQRVGTINIDGEKFRKVWRDTDLSQEAFARVVGMKRSNVFRLTRSGVHSMFTGNFKNVADYLKISTEELRKRIAVPDKEQSGDDERLVIRLPSVLRTSMEQAAAEKQVSLQHLVVQTLGEKFLKRRQLALLVNYTFGRGAESSSAAGEASTESTQSQHHRSSRLE